MTDEGQTKEIRANSYHQAQKVAFSEILFVILPIIILSISLGHRGRIGDVFFAPEWSIISVVICGQAVIKLADRIFILKVPVNRWTHILRLSVVIVFLFVPNVMVLSFVLENERLSGNLAAIQVIWFFLTACLYWYSVFSCSRANG
jgi:hypothetical protein